MKMKKDLKIVTGEDSWPTCYTGENVEQKELLISKDILNSQERKLEEELANSLEAEPTSTSVEVPKKKQSHTAKKRAILPTTGAPRKMPRVPEQTCKELCPSCGKARHSLSWPYSTQRPTVAFETALTTLLNGFLQKKIDSHQCVVGYGDLQVPARPGGFTDWMERYGLTPEEAGLMDLLTNLSHYSTTFTTILTKYRVLLTTCSLRSLTGTPLESLQRVDLLIGHLDTLCSLLTETSGYCGQTQTSLLTKKRSFGGLNISDILRASEILRLRE